MRFHRRFKSWFHTAVFWWNNGMPLQSAFWSTSLNMGLQSITSPNHRRLPFYDFNRLLLSSDFSNGSFVWFTFILLSAGTVQCVVEVLPRFGLHSFTAEWHVTAQTTMGNFNFWLSLSLSDSLSETLSWAVKFRLRPKFNLTLDLRLSLSERLGPNLWSKYRLRAKLSWTLV